MPGEFGAVMEEINRDLEALITDIEKARKELRQIIDLVPDPIFAKNRDGEYLLANVATANAYGLEVAEVEGNMEADVIPEVEDSEQFRTDDLEIIESGEPKERSEELTTVDGETRRFQTTRIPYEAPGSGEDAVLGYARDVTDLKEYERTLERQRDNLEILNQIICHDIRNDLQLVLAYAETLEDSVEDSGEEYVRQILKTARNAVEITNGARDITEVLLQPEAEHSPVRLRYVLQEHVNEVQSNHEHALVAVDGPIPEVEVLADEMLGSVFRNLLTNAIVHNDAELPEVTVSVTLDEGVVRVFVADNGPGIPDDHKERIFQKGEKGLNGDGTGLGLYLVGTLVDRYDGNVWIEDNEPEGSIFVVELAVVS